MLGILIVSLRCLLLLRLVGLITLPLEFRQSFEKRFIINVHAIHPWPHASYSCKKFSKILSWLHHFLHFLSYSIRGSCVINAEDSEPRITKEGQSLLRYLGEFQFKTNENNGKKISSKKRSSYNDDLKRLRTLSYFKTYSSCLPLTALVVA